MKLKHFAHQKTLGRKLRVKAKTWRTHLQCVCVFVSHKRLKSRIYTEPLQFNNRQSKTKTGKIKQTIYKRKSMTGQ